MQEVRAKLAAPEGTANDKLRLAVLLLLVSDKLPATADLDAMRAELSDAGADVSAFQYVLRMKQMNLTGDGAAPGGPTGGTAGSAAPGWGLPGLVDSSLVSGIAGQFGKHLSKLVGGTRQVRPLPRRYVLFTDTRAGVCMCCVKRARIRSRCAAQALSSCRTMH